MFVLVCIISAKIIKIAYLQKMIGFIHEKSVILRRKIKK